MREWGETATGVRHSLYICIKPMTSRATRVLLIDASTHISILYMYACAYSLWVRAECQCTRFLRLYAMRILNVPSFRLPMFVICCLLSLFLYCMQICYSTDRVVIGTHKSGQIHWIWLYAEDDVIVGAGRARLLGLGLAWLALDCFRLVWFG